MNFRAVSTDVRTVRQRNRESSRRGVGFEIVLPESSRFASVLASLPRIRKPFGFSYTGAGEGGLRPLPSIPLALE